ncbi:MAG: hypothetical protein K2J75_00160, partial [Clostridia bacterium]|nr:hypothetical protein [Clostridia bacterium]
MCSNMHKPPLWPQYFSLDSMPSSVTITISPGRTSLSKVAPMVSNAHLSLANTKLYCNLPMQSGRL